MRVIDCEQGGEEWDRWRARPTASEFGRIITPAKGDYAAASRDYACELIAKILGIWQKPKETFWMQWGTTHEPLAIQDYEDRRRVVVEPVGFVLPDDTDAYGCSPDGLVGDDGLIEVKCPKPENVISVIVRGEMPKEYKPQVQGQLLITGREWCDFVCWHPELPAAAEYRIERDESYIGKLREHLATFCETLESAKRAIVENPANQCRVSSEPAGHLE